MNLDGEIGLVLQGVETGALMGVANTTCISVNVAVAGSSIIVGMTTLANVVVSSSSATVEDADELFDTLEGIAAVDTELFDTLEGIAVVATCGSQSITSNRAEKDTFPL